MQVFSNRKVMLIFIVILFSGCAYKNYENNDEAFLTDLCKAKMRNPSVHHAVDCTNFHYKDENESNSNALLQPILGH